MKKIKRILVIFSSILTLNLLIPWTVFADHLLLNKKAKQTLYAKAEPAEYKPEIRVILEKDIPKKEEGGWFSKYKWWIALGVVAIAGGAAAAAGGGGGGDSPPDNNGSHTITW